MKNKKFVYFLIGIVVLFVVTLLYSDIRFFNKQDAQKQAKVDPSKEFVVGTLTRNKSGMQLDTTSLQHYTIKVREGDNDSLLTSVLKKIPTDIPLLLTLETVLGQSNSNVLEDVISGRYDAGFKAISKEISDWQSPVYLRWNPEMEVPVKLFLWQYQSPKVYNEAFNHFAKICKKNNPGVRIVWGSAGYPGAEEYWPGPDLVDYASIIVNGKSEEVATAFPKEGNLETAIRRKILRMRFIGKPILVLASDTTGSNSSSIKSALTKAASKLEQEKDVALPSLLNVQINPNPNLYRQSQVVAGVYDPRLLLTKSPGVAVEHIFIDLTNIQDGSFLRDFNSIMHRKHAAIITVEPWRDQKVRGVENVLINTINGVYDEEFAKVYETISNAGQMVYLRFAHEMEIPIHRYAWQSQDPVLYVKAFRYFMNQDKIKAPNVRKVWGPAGDRGSMEFWPGDDVVDYISIAIYGLPDKNITDANQQESFGHIFERKSYRMRLLNKPIFITEFGVKGPEEFQQKWMKDASATIKSHKEIHGACYFNLADNPKVWGKIPPPDWGISKSTYELFVKSIN